MDSRCHASVIDLMSQESMSPLSEPSIDHVLHISEQFIVKE